MSLVCPPKGIDVYFCITEMNYRILTGATAMVAQTISQEPQQQEGHYSIRSVFLVHTSARTQHTERTSCAYTVLRSSALATQLVKVPALTCAFRHAPRLFKVYCCWINQTQERQVPIPNSPWGSLESPLLLCTPPTGTPVPSFVRTKTQKVWRLTKHL